MEPWEPDLNEYIRQGEPGKAEKSSARKTAIGLQAVDGLKTSPYLPETAKEHIEGKISIRRSDTGRVRTPCGEVHLRYLAGGHSMKGKLPLLGTLYLKK